MPAFRRSDGGATGATGVPEAATAPRRGRVDLRRHPSIQALPGGSALRTGPPTVHCSPSRNQGEALW
ncbi:hypothetical protein GCM10027452_24450 [Micromonospora halotolerans]